MKTLSQRLSFRLTKNLGVGALLAILIGIVAFSYVATERSLNSLHRIVQMLLSAQDVVLKVNDYVRAANQSFVIYIRRDRISSETVLDRLDLIESRLRRLESVAPRGASGPGVDLSLVSRARTAFIYYLDEELIDPAADSAAAYLQQLSTTLTRLREQLLEYGARRQGTLYEEPGQREVIEISRILDSTEFDLHRYVDREQVSIEDIQFPVGQAEKLLKMPELDWAGLPQGTIANISDLSSALSRYRSALNELFEEERVTGEVIYPDFERTVSQASGAAEIALISLNQMMSRHIVDNQSQLIALEEQQQDVLLMLGLSGAILAIGVSYLLGRALSARLRDLVDGTKQVGKGVQGYRLEVGANDEVGVLARAFNDMLVEMEEKEAALQRHIENLDAAHRSVQEAKENLERQVSERTRELRDALDEAQVANRTKDEFLAKVSHEIRAPLNGVLGMADILLRSKLDDHQRHLMRTLQESGDSLLRIINDILDFSRIESGRLAMQKRKFDPVATIESTVDIMARSVQSKGLEFIYYLPVNFPKAMEGDPDRLRQVLLNLLDNAVKFTERGEVSLQGKIEHDTNRDVLMRLEVCDTGVGIPENARSRIFEPFNQADSSSTRRFMGTGLGLTISKQLIEAMNGEIGFSSLMPSGTCFWVKLPLDKYPANAVYPSNDALLGRRILIAESNPSCRAVLARLIDEIGCVSDPVDSGRVALERIRAMGRNARYDAVIVDSSLTDVDGLELARISHREASTIPMPFILLTPANTDDELVSSSIWIAGTLEKPVRRERLSQALRSLIDTPVDTDLEQIPERPKALKNLRVLVAEDNPVSQEVMRYILEGLGCQVEVASDGRQALDAFERTPFNIVLLDCQMPHVDGYQVAQKIRQREGAWQHTPLLALTASAMESDRQHCLAVGMDDYLTKPVNEKMLLEAISRWCPPGLA
jgi:signal transduction histidine kinase/DNA-binding response OmpR family regulator